MNIEAKELYTSSNGDRWLLVRYPDTQEVLISASRTRPLEVNRRIPQSGNFFVPVRVAPSTPPCCT